jgi:hypothetical protein
MPQPRRRRPVKVEVDTERVEGQIELTEIVRRMQRSAQRQARAARRDPQVSAEVEERYRSVHRLAAELADHLEALDVDSRGSGSKGS